MLLVNYLAVVSFWQFRSIIYSVVYSINYVGTFVKDVKFVRAELRVSRKWQGGEFTAEGIDSLTPNIYGIRYNSNK